MQNTRKVQQAVEYVGKRLANRPSPLAGLILGTGLGGLVDQLQDPIWINYNEIPGFPVSTVDSHAGQLGHGLLAGVPVLVQNGRFHLYEGYEPTDVVMGVRTMAGLGARLLIATCAAGALNPQFDAGSIMLITDQINMTGKSPLTGPNEDAWGPRFPDMSQLFSQRLCDHARLAAQEAGIPLERGVYVGVLGPQMETPAETRAYRILGADAIGMSTVQETMAAHHMGLAVLGFAILSNKNLPDCMDATSLEDVICMAQSAGNDLSRLVVELLPRVVNEY